MTIGHLTELQLGEYVDGESPMPADVLWALEAHLTRCAGCRERLTHVAASQSPDVFALLEQVRRQLALELPASPQMPKRSSWRGHVVSWAAPSVLPRVAMTIVVVLVALGLDLADNFAGSRFPSLVLLLAPLAPMLGVAAAWSRSVDPAHELVVASPRAGLPLVLRRTLAALIVVIPVVAAAGWFAGTSPALWLLPALAFTASALALGELIGLNRAAAALATLWVVGVAAPSLIMAKLPVVLEPASLPGWIVLSVVVTAVLVLQGRAYTELSSGR